jgi:hypothetical protein
VQTTTAVVNTSRPYSVTAWVQLRQVDANYHTAIGIDGVQVSAFFLQFRPEAPTPGFAFAALPSDAPAAATAVARATTTPMANVWYHLAGVFDGTIMKLYVNGAFQQSVPSARRGSRPVAHRSVAAATPPPMPTSGGASSTKCASTAVRSPTRKSAFSRSRES